MQTFFSRNNSLIDVRIELLKHDFFALRLCASAEVIQFGKKVIFVKNSASSVGVMTHTRHCCNTFYFTIRALISEQQNERKREKTELDNANAVPLFYLP